MTLETISIIREGRPMSAPRLVQCHPSRSKLRRTLAATSSGRLITDEECPLAERSRSLTDSCLAECWKILRKYGTDPYDPQLFRTVCSFFNFVEEQHLWMKSLPAGTSLSVAIMTIPVESLRLHFLACYLDEEERQKKQCVQRRMDAP